ncbi:MAG TPA: hypothetical protein VNA20_13070, partial [Frankiaceae bacterium]|nr:hypothetical protein [Frankiaceae bacterium]
MTAVETAPPGLAHLLTRLALVEARVRRAVEERRATDPNPDDPFRGLYLSEEAVALLLDAGRDPLAPDPFEEERRAAAERDADATERSGGDVRLRRLIREFGLTALDVEALLVALLPDVDPRFEQLYGYLNDDVTRRRASIGVTLTLCGVPEASAAARARFGADAPLVAGGLLVVEDVERPLLSRGLRVPDRVTAYLLGDDRPDPALAEVTGGPPPPLDLPGGPLARALAAGVRLAYLRETAGGGGQATVAAAAGA